MRRVGLGLALGAISAVAAVAACALDESGAASDGGSPDVVTLDGGPDGNFADADAADVTFDVPDLGVGETEAGLPCTCVTDVPNGYTVVEYVAKQQPGCTAGYDASTDYLENPQAGASTCSCTCSGAPANAACSCGANPATFDVSSGNGNCTDVTNESLQANAGTCFGVAQSLNPLGNKLNDMLVAPASPCKASGGTCGAGTPTQTFPTPTVDQARTCTLAAPTAACNGGTCIPSQGGPYALCVTNFAVGSCGGLTDFPVAHLVGTGTQDDRSCGPSPCTCSVLDAGSCGTPTLDLWNTSTSCGGSPDESLPADNATCSSVGFANGQTFASTRYSVAQSGGACGFTGTFSAQGGVVLTNRFTICCRP